MIIAKLPRSLLHSKGADLIRVGSDNDGGYVVSKSDILNSDMLLSFGIETNWSFEEDFLNLKTVPLHAFDASTKKGLFFRHVRKEFLDLNFKKSYEYYVKYLKYKKFFTGSNSHEKKFVGLDCGGLHISMDDVFSEFCAENTFIKMDIEGSEYRCLESFIKNQDKLSGLTIEFHDVDLHIDKIIEFKERFDLNLIHIHANNYAPVTKSGMPTVLELTFSRYAKTNDEVALYPEALDQPNRERREDFLITFAS